MEKNKKYRKVGKSISKELYKKFESLFGEVPVKDNLQIVKVQGVPEIISVSNTLREKKQSLIFAQAAH